jgi:hypothetical protein
MPSTGATSRSWYAGPFARWLACVAALVQAFIPLLVAAELGLAQPADDGMLCAMGEAHHAAAAHQGDALHDGDTGQTAPAAGHHAPCCAICVALHAAQAFTAPATVALPIPRARDADAIADAGLSLAALPFPGSYNSRAPPTLA